WTTCPTTTPPSSPSDRRSGGSATGRDGPVDAPLLDQLSR
ncbi:MAG: hypothetical protein AVDCRST_MAG54-2961, partial [uncultured Actinomycetospora sp.]